MLFKTFQKLLFQTFQKLLFKQEKNCLKHFKNVAKHEKNTKKYYICYKNPPWRAAMVKNLRLKTHISSDMPKMTTECHNYRKRFTKLWYSKRARNQRENKNKTNKEEEINVVRTMAYRIDSYIRYSWKIILCRLRVIFDKNT